MTFLEASSSDRRPELVRVHHVARDSDVGEVRRLTFTIELISLYCVSYSFSFICVYMICVMMLYFGLSRGESVLTRASCGGHRSDFGEGVALHLSHLSWIGAATPRLRAPGRRCERAT